MGDPRQKGLQSICSALPCLLFPSTWFRLHLQGRSPVTILDVLPGNAPDPQLRSRVHSATVRARVCVWDACAFACACVCFQSHVP